MKKTLLFVSLLIVLAFLSANTVFAGDSLSLSISCTIPAIPGLNAPLIEEETSRIETGTSAQQKPESGKETQPQTPALIQQDTQEEKIISEGQKSLVTVKTLYSR